MPKSIINEYLDTVDSVYGVFLDSCHGFESAVNLFKKTQFETIQTNINLTKNSASTNNTIYPTTLEDVDSGCLIYSKGNKISGDYRILHYCPTQTEYKQRNSPEGRNYRFIGNMAVISLFEYWDSSCRNKLAEYHKTDRDNIKSDILGELRHLRNSIIHHRGIANKSIEKCKIFNWYHKCDQIFIDGEKMEIIVSAIKESKLDLYYVDTQEKV